MDHPRPCDLFDDIILTRVAGGWVLALSPLGLNCLQTDMPEGMAWGAAHERIWDIVLR